MDELSRVLFGEADAMFMSRRKKLRYMALKFGVNIRRPVRDEQGNKVGLTKFSRKGFFNFRKIWIFKI